MWQKFSFYDFRVIAHYLGVLMMFLAAAECVPFVVAVVLGEWQPASHYLFGMGVALIVGSLLRLILPSPGKLTPKQALAVTGFGMACAGSFGVHTFIYVGPLWQHARCGVRGNERVDHDRLFVGARYRPYVDRR